METYLVDKLSWRKEKASLSFAVKRQTQDHGLISCFTVFVHKRTRNRPSVFTKPVNPLTETACFLNHSDLYGGLKPRPHESG